MIKKARLGSTPASHNDQSGPSGLNPGPPRSTPSSSIPRSSGSKIGSDEHQSSEEGEDSSDDDKSSELSQMGQNTQTMNLKCSAILHLLAWSRKETS